MPIDFFDEDGELDSEKLNERANYLVKKQGYTQLRSTLSLGTNQGNYVITDKQRQFISISLSSFNEFYSQMYELHKKGNDWHLLKTIKDSLARRFAMDRASGMVGDPKVETNGFFRGLISIWFLYKEENKNQQSNDLKNACEKIREVVKFFGSYQNAQLTFVEFLLRFALRFQNAIELLANHKRGIGNLANFIATVTLQKIIQTMAVKYHKIENVQQKSALLTKLILQGDDDKILKQVWQDNELITENKDNKWTILSLLRKSPVESKSELYIYPGKSHEKHTRWRFFYPAQACSEKEAEKLKFYEKAKIHTV